MLMPPQGIGEFRTKETNFASPGLGVLVAAQSTNRVLLIFSSAAGPWTLTTNQPAVALNGLVIAASFPDFAISWHDHGPLVNLAWRVGSSVAGTLTVFEVFYEPHLRHGDN